MSEGSMTTEHVECLIDQRKITLTVLYQDIDCGFIALHNAFFEVLKRHYPVGDCKNLSLAIAKIQKDRGVLTTGKMFTDNKEMN